MDFTPPILGGGFSGGGARAVPVRIREEATGLFPTGSRELSGARLVSSACTCLDTSAIEGRPEGRVSHSYSASPRHARLKNSSASNHRSIEEEISRGPKVSAEQEVSSAT